MSVVAKALLSTQEYLQGEEAAEVKHEFLDGEVWAMVGATDTHVTVAGNLFFLLKQNLKGTPCRTFISDMKVNVAQANAFFYPDVLVTCDPRDRDNTLYKQHPLFIAEVLSPSTEAFDRGRKFATYRLSDSLQHYWLIDSQSLSVDTFTREQNGNWLLHGCHDLNDIVTIPQLAFEC
ncbi:MAG: Uma2 family endonuclease, partial [Gammaproteobacteria bacterium]